MKFIVLKASDYEYRKEVEINSLEELMEFMNSTKYSIIIEKDYDHITDKLENTLTIYDDYLE
jgi:hypothetical protein